MCCTPGVCQLSYTFNATINSTFKNTFSSCDEYINTYTIDFHILIFAPNNSAKPSRGHLSHDGVLNHFNHW